MYISHRPPPPIPLSPFGQTLSLSFLLHHQTWPLDILRQCWIRTSLSPSGENDLAPPFPSQSQSLLAELSTGDGVTTSHDHTSPSPSSTTTAMQTTNPLSVTHSCSQSWLRLSPASSDEEKQLVVIFPPSAVGHSANCTWILPVLDSSTSNVFSFHTTYNQTVCSRIRPSHYLAIYDTFPQRGVFIADSCSGPGWKCTGSSGFNTTIQYTSSNITSTTVVLGSYQLILEAERIVSRQSQACCGRQRAVLS